MGEEWGPKRPNGGDFLAGRTRLADLTEQNSRLASVFGKALSCPYRQVRTVLQAGSRFGASRPLGTPITAEDCAEASPHLNARYVDGPVCIGVVHLIAEAEIPQRR